MKKPAGYEKYIKSAQWTNISNLMKRQAKYLCAHCKRPSPTLETHHLNYDRFGHERMSDLVVLCVPCHKEADAKRVADRQARGELARHKLAYDTYMTKKHGEDYILYESPHHYEEFENWLQEKEESEYEEY